MNNIHINQCIKKLQKYNLRRFSDNSCAGNILALAVDIPALARDPLPETGAGWAFEMVAMAARKWLENGKTPDFMRICTQASFHN